MVNNNTNRVLSAAKGSKSDEFYTRMDDIVKECDNYADYFRGKIVYCNCDDYETSNFVKYFLERFDSLGLNGLYATSHDPSGFNGKILVKTKEYEKKGWTSGDGSYNSKYCLNLLKQCDVVVTNPPFSLLKEFIPTILSYGKKLLVIGNTNAITYSEIFPYIKANELWLGCSSFNTGMYFKVPFNYEYADNYKFKREINGEKVLRVSSICWFTNIPHNKQNPELELTKKYDPNVNFKYDNYDGVECNNIYDIPSDYAGVIGVPITFLNKYNPEQFEIVDKLNCPKIDGCPIYKRLLIRKK